jgi:regulatory protein
MLPGMYKQRAPKPVTAERLEKAALFYLGRFASTRANLRRVLLRKLDRAEDLPPEAKAGLTAVIDRLLARYEASGLLNDAVFAEGKIASLRRRGDSQRTIRQKLALKGVEKEVAEEKLAEDEQDDLGAAWAFARRRRLGPYRTDKRAEFRQKDMAAFGRAGFDYRTAKTVVEGEIELA